MYSCIPIASVLLMLLIFFSCIENILEYKMSFFLLLAFIILLVGNVISFFVFQNYSLKIFENRQQNIIISRQRKDIEYYMQMAEVNEEQKEMLHDTVHTLKVISKLAKDKNYKAIQVMVGELGCAMVKDGVSYTTNRILDAILLEKYNEALKQGIHSDFYVEPGVVLDMISYVDLASIMGNLLDNAISAALGCKEEKYVKAYIFMQGEGGFCIIKVVNGFSDEVITNEKGFISTKQEKGVHGIGIYSVNKIAEKYGGYLTCNIERNIFKAIVLLSTDVVCN